MSSAPPQKTMILAGGCFWCVEAVFQRLLGVVSVAPGYVWMRQGLPSEEDVSRQPASRMEAIKLTWRSNELRLEDILDVFYATSSSGLVDWAMPGEFSNVRSGIFLEDDTDIALAEKHKTTVKISEGSGGTVKTQILKMPSFEPAPLGDRNYYLRNPKDGFSRSIITPKLVKLFRDFPKLVH